MGPVVDLRGDVLDEERGRYVEEFGLLFGQFGLPRMFGRVLGVLMVADPPERSAEELAEIDHFAQDEAINLWARSSETSDTVM